MPSSYATLGGIIYKCKHFKETVAYYTEILGGTIAGAPTEKQCIVAFNEKQRLYLVDDTYSGDNNADNFSFHHICLQMEDANATLLHMQQHGYDVFSGPNAREGTKIEWPMTETDRALCRTYCFFSVDPEGNDVEFMQLTEECLQQGWKEG